MKIDGLNPEQLSLLAKWEAADKNQRRFREEELELRSQVMRSVFGMDKDVTDTDTYKGTHYAALPSGWRLKVECKTDYKLTNKEGQTDAALDALSEGEADLLVRWTPELSVSNYKSLPAEKQALFANALTIKNASPAFELVAPKVK
jgi:hypothetical protein